MRLLLVRFVLILAILIPATPALAQAAPSCRFVLGFATLDKMIPKTVGTCLEDEQHNPANGDALQHTTGGLMVWRKSDNWTAFTDGYRTWINGPDGLIERLNTQRCTWEGGATACRAPGESSAGRSLRLISTFPTSATAEDVAVDTTTNRIYLSNGDVIDGTDNTVLTNVGVPGAWAVTVDPVAQQLYLYGRHISPTDDDITSVSTANDQVENARTCCYGYGGMAVDTGTGNLFIISNGGCTGCGRVVVTAGETLQTLGDIKVGPGPGGIAVDPQARRVYVGDETDGNVYVLDGARDTVLTSIPVGMAGDKPIALAIDPSRHHLYVATFQRVVTIDTSSSRVTGSVQARIDCPDSRGHVLAVNPTTDHVFALDCAKGAVSVLDAATNTIVASLKVGSMASGIAVNSTTNRAYVVDSQDGTVSVIQDS